MNGFLQKELLLISVVLAACGAGLWFGSAQSDAAYLSAIAPALLSVAFCLLLLWAIAHRQNDLARQSEDHWFAEQAFDDGQAYLLIDAKQKIHAANERARIWFGARVMPTVPLAGLIGDTGCVTELIAARHERTADEQASVRITCMVRGIAVPMCVSVQTAETQAGIFVLAISPLAASVPTSQQPSGTEFYGLLMESSLSAKIVVDAKGVVVDYNPAAQTLLGFTRDEIIGADMAEHIIPLRWRAGHVQGFERFLQVGAGEVIARRVEFAALHKNGGEIPVELTINAINTDQGMYFGAEIRDLRDWHALEQEMRGAREDAEQANISKSRFLATMSHEIRTPLNALLGILGMAKADEKDAHQLSLLVTAETAAQRLMRLLSNVLDYSKVEAGEMSNDLRAISPAAVVQDVADLFGPNLHASGVELACSFGTAKDLWVLGDTQKVTQIVTNLVSNAVKFTEQGRIDIALDCDDLNVANACYRIKVRDSGIGMTQMQLDKVFDAFVQVDDSDRRKYLGSGLGLSISKQLALLMQGELTVTSTPKQGSEFVLTLPLSHMTRPDEVFNTERIKADTSGNRRVLVVEDSKPNQLVVKSMLERHGYEVDVVDDGIEACAAMKRKGQGSTAYGLILMDVQMPGMDGLEATRWIRNNGYSQPIIALTAKAFMEDEKACLEAGMNDFMAKPVNYEALLNRVDMWLGQQADSPRTTLSEKVEEMHVLLGDSALHEALGVFVVEVEQRHATLQAALQRDDLAAAATELHTLFGIYTGYGFDDLGHMCRGLEEACVAGLMPQSSALAHFANMSEQLLKKIPAYQGELSSAAESTLAVLGDSS